MLAELVRTETVDGVVLDGAFFASPHAAATRAALVLHGVGGNFYSSRLLQQLTDSLLPEMHVLRVNTRGHDGAFQGTSCDGPRRWGAAYELVDHCRLDVNVWLNWLCDRGARRLLVAGHSLGAIKSVYSQAYAAHPHTEAVIAISAPRLSPTAFASGPSRDDYFAVRDEAQRFLDAGQPQRLIESRFPYPLLITAAGYLDKYGSDRYNVMRFADRLPCRSLFVYGQLELEQGGTPFEGIVPDLEALPTTHPLETRVVPQADHFYRERESQLCQTVAQWLAAA